MTLEKKDWDPTAKNLRISLGSGGRLLIETEPTCSDANNGREPTGPPKIVEPLTRVKRLAIYADVLGVVLRFGHVDESRGDWF